LELPQAQVNHQVEIVITQVVVGALTILEVETAQVV
jgi:hypothetical protein